MTIEPVPVKTVAAAHQNIKEEEYWIEELSNVPEKCNFPHSIKTNKKDRKINSLIFTIPGDIFTKLMRISTKSDPKLHMILTTGLFVLLNKYTGKDDIIIGTPIYKPDVQGEFINLVLALRIVLFPDMDFKQLLQEVRKSIIGANEHRNYPIEMIVEQLNIPLSTRSEEFPLFDVGILLESIHYKEYFENINLNMVFSFVKVDERLDGIVEYNSAIYQEKTIERICLHFTRLLESVISNSDIKISDINFLLEEEKEQLLFEFNNTQSGYPKDKTIHTLFQEQVERTPENAALCFEEEQLTYKVLNTRANQLAWLLRKKGIGSNAILGIMMEDSLDMVIGILGILKAGGAYMPINPYYPQNRIMTMLNDSGSRILLSKENELRPFDILPIQYLEPFESKLVITPPRPVIQDLDSLQMVDRSYINYEKYSSYIGQSMMKNSISLHFSRGCTYNCAFCFKVWPRFAYHHRSGENLFEEIHFYYKMGVTRFSFLDDLPNFNIKESSKIYELILKHGLKVHIYFPNGIRGDILTKEYIDLLVEAGTVSIDVGLETTSPRLQKLINKNLNLERLHENICYIIEKYPHVILETQLVHGIPTETVEEARASLDYLKSLKWIHFPYFHILKIFPNTPMAKLAEENGISREAIERSDKFGYGNLPETLPFPKNVSLKFQSEFVSEYFLSKERLISVLPHQMRVLTEDELAQKYNSYIPGDIKSLSGLLRYAGIREDEVKGKCLPNDYGIIPGLNEKIKAGFPVKIRNENSFNLLLLDLSSYFSHDRHDVVYDVLEPPLGLAYLMTYVQRKFGPKVRGKVLKVRVDFDSYNELKSIIKEFKPNLIGIRTLNFFKDFFHRIVSLLKRWEEDIPIVTGGPYATCSYKSLLKDKNVDLAVLGEGEITFCELIEKMLENGGKLPGENVLRNIPGIAFAADKDKAFHKRFNREILLLDQLDDIVSRESLENPGNINKSNDLVYIMHTSGSSGTPKGVMVQHNNAVNLVTWFARTYQITNETNVLQLSNFSFDPTVEDVFATLLHGATLHLGNRDLVLDRERFCEYIEKNQIHIIDFIPTMLKQLLSTDTKLESLRVVISGGEKLPESLKDRLIGQGYSLYNNYGPTEVTVDALVSKCSAEKVNLGYPISNVTVYILDKYDHLLPVEVPGELAVGGAGIARGYMNRPGITAGKFKDNPFVKGERLYKTGDIVKRLPDGKIEFIGRVDTQVKIRGYRIETGEVEFHILNHPYVDEAIVIIGGKNADGSEDPDNYLVAYVVLKPPFPDEHFKLADLKEELSMELPGYMLPSYFIQLDKIPLTPNGKVDKRALPLPLYEKKADDINHVEPESDLEKTIASIWKTVLNKDKIGINDNFFDLGGNSMQIVNLNTKLKEKLGRDIPVVKMFRYPKISSFINYLNQENPVDSINDKKIEEAVDTMEEAFQLLIGD